MVLTYYIDLTPGGSEVASEDYVTFLPEVMKGEGFTGDSSLITASTCFILTGRGHVDNSILSVVLIDERVGVDRFGNEELSFSCEIDDRAVIVDILVTIGVDYHLH